MIKLFDPVIAEDAIDAVGSVLRSGWIGTGPITAEFEASFAEYVGAKYAVALTSATAALHLAVKSLDLNPGDEVITTPITFISTNHVLLYESLVPVFCDVEEDTLNLDLEKAEALVSNKTKAIMVVHYAGNPLNMDKLYSFAERHGLKVIEDAAHACGASYRKRKIGSFGLTCFSFQAVKNLPAGDGGAITTDDEGLYQELLRLRWMGIGKSTFDRIDSTKYSWDYDVGSIGYKYAMNDITASLALSGLSHLDENNSVRRALFNEYHSCLKPSVHRLIPTLKAISSQHLFVIRVPDRDGLHAKLTEAGISSGVHYRPNHLYTMYRKFVREPLPVAERVYSEILSLPMHTRLSKEDVRTVCDVVNS